MLLKPSTKFIRLFVVVRSLYKLLAVILEDLARLATRKNQFDLLALVAVIQVVVRWGLRW